MTVPVLASLALLQGAPTTGIAQMIFMYGAIFAIFYFVLIRPQQKQRKQHEQRVQQLRKGDEIVTAGGLVGEVVHIAAQGKDGAATMQDRITIRSGESKVVIERGRIAAIGGSAPVAP